MTPEETARVEIDEKLAASGWIVQNRDAFNPAAGIGVAVREYPTSTGPADYALFVDGTPVGVIEAKKAKREKILQRSRGNPPGMREAP